jgi:hypothetical protein
MDYKNLEDKFLVENLSEICNKFSVTISSSIIKRFKSFYHRFAKKLEYLDQSILNLYSKIFAYKYSNGEKKIFMKNEKAAIFNMALKEVNEYLKNEEPIENFKEEKHSTCNLYSFKV